MTGSKVLDRDSDAGKTRVCLFTTVLRADDVRLFHRECKSLVKAGFDVHVVICSDLSGTVDGVHFHAAGPANNRLHRMLVKPWIVMWKALMIKAKIYHFHDPELLIVGFIMRWALSKRVVFDMRESTARQIMGKEYLPRWSRRVISLCYRVIEKVCLHGISVVVANDRSAEEHKGAYLVRNFPEVDEELMANAMDMSERLKSPLVVYVGGVWESRGALVYVELARRLKERGHKFRLMIIGQHGADFGRQLTQMVQEVGLVGMVEITGHVDYLKAMQVVSRAVIGLSILRPIPNYTFCLAGKMVEYMMCGTPVLASDFEHWRPYVEGEKVGRMVDPNNIEEIVNVCEQMLDNPDELVAMGRRGMEAVRRKYNWSLEFTELLRCYDDLLKKAS